MHFFYPLPKKHFVEKMCLMIRQPRRNKTSFINNIFPASMLMSQTVPYHKQKKKVFFFLLTKQMFICQIFDIQNILSYFFFWFFKSNKNLINDSKNTVKVKN